MKSLFAFLLVLIFSVCIFSQDSKDDIPHQFEIIKKVEASSVKSQGRTGTCWSFATTSFLEAELIRLGKGEIDISEMFFVRKDYPLKADKYMRYHGRSNFGNGGLAHDALLTIKKCGILPESAYGGKLVDSTTYNHFEMHGILKSMHKSILSS